MKEQMKALQAELTRLSAALKGLQAAQKPPSQQRQRPAMELLGKPAPEAAAATYDGKEIKIYPISEWERVERTLADKTADGNSLDGKRKNKILFLANHFGAEQSLDNQGRILVPVPLREGSGAGCEIKMVWQSNHLLAMSEENYDKKMTQNMLDDEELSYAENLGF